MKHQRNIIALVVIAAVTLIALPSALLAQNGTGSGAKNQNKTTNSANRLGVLELTMQQSAGKDDKAFAHAQGEYWSLISSQNDFPRAYNFFSNLAAAHPSSPDILGLEGSAIGGYIGWLYAAGNGNADEHLVMALDSQARSSFGKALQIDSNNFYALFGYAIYESYNPNGAEHSKELFAKLEGLRSSHPEYPWQVVDGFKNRAAK